MATYADSRGDLQGTMRFPLDVEPGHHVMSEDHRMYRVVDPPIASGDRVCIVVREAENAPTRKIWFRRNAKVLTRTGQEQIDLIKQEFGFDYMPRPGV